MCLVREVWEQGGCQCVGTEIACGGEEGTEGRGGEERGSKGEVFGAEFA